MGCWRWWHCRRGGKKNPLPSVQKNVLILLSLCAGWGVGYLFIEDGIAVSFLLCIFTKVCPICLYFLQDGLLKTHLLNALIGLDSLRPWS